MQCFAAWSLWFLGQPDQALHRMEDALTLARDLSEPHGLARALYFAAILHHLRREPTLARERAEAAIALSSEHKLMLYQAHATVTRGWALIEQGLQESEIEGMRHGLAARQATGTELMRPHLSAQLAEALSKVRQTKEGLRVVEEALAVAHSNGERCYEAELYRLKGELLLMQSTRRAVPQAATGSRVGRAITNAEVCFKESIKIAQRQKAKSLELRAAMSMARLYQNQGKQQEGRLLLAQIYDGFTEGFNTRDLREAKALLSGVS